MLAASATTHQPTLAASATRLLAPPIALCPPATRRYSSRGSLRFLSNSRPIFWFSGRLGACSNSRHGGRSMHRTWLCSTAMLCCAALLAALGCQNPSWNNPYSVFGPATIPPATMQSAPQPGYYQPPAATPTLSSSSPAVVTPPIVTLPDGSAKPGMAVIRSEIASTPILATPANLPAAPSSPIVSKPSSASPSSSSFSTAG